MRDRSKPRYIYFARPVDADGRIKIGCSYRPANRLIVLSGWSPYPIEIIAVAPGGFDVERALHQHFVADALHREWFRSSPELLFVIECMSRHGMSLSEAAAAFQMRQAA